MARPTAGSTHGHPVTISTMAPTMTASEPTVSATTSRKAPSTLSDSFAPRRRRPKAIRLAARPTTATTSIGPVSTSTGSVNRRTASTST